MWDSKGVLGLMMPTLWTTRGTYGEFLDPLVELIEDGTITPVIDRVFALEDAPAAHARLAERRNVGKVVLAHVGRRGRCTHSGWRRRGLGGRRRTGVARLSTRAPYGVAWITRIACAAISDSPSAFGCTITGLVPWSTGSTQRTPIGLHASWPSETPLRST